MNFLRTLLLLLITLLVCWSTPARAATFKFYWDASAQSGNTVKLIRNGYTFAGSSPNVITMTWDATNGIYEAVLDDGTHVNDYWRIEDGSGNVVVDSFTVSSKIIDADQIEDSFVRNDGDDLKRGNLQVRPESGTTNVELIIDNSGTTIQVTASDTGSVSTTGHVLQFQAASIDLQTSGAADIPVTGVGQSATANSAATRSNIDTLKGSGWAWDSGNNTIMGLRSDVNDLMGTGTFSAYDSLFIDGGGGRGILSVQWSFVPAGVNDSIDFVQIYFGTSAVPGYSQSGAAGLSSATLTQIRSNLTGVIYPERGAFSANIPALQNYYVIVVAFDHTSPTPQAWGSNQVLITGNEDPLDSSTPLIGDASSIVDGLEQLANEVNDVKVNLGGGNPMKVLFTDNNSAVASSVTLNRYYNTATAASSNIIVGWYKSSAYDALRISGQARHSDVSQTATVKLEVFTWTGVAAVASGSTSVTSTSLTNFSLDLDCSALTDGWYQVIMKIQDDDNSTADTACVHFPTIETFNN